MFLATGCATIIGNRKFESLHDQIQKGTTTRTEVINLLGKPNDVEHPDEEHRVLIYDKYKIYKEHWYSRAICDHQQMTVFIDSNDVVTEYKIDSMAQCPSSNGNNYHPPVPVPAYKSTMYNNSNSFLSPSAITGSKY